MKAWFIVVAVLTAASCMAEMDEWLPPKMITPPNNALTPQRAALGKLLFFDKRLSKGDDISCATCHIPYNAWTDGLQKAVGHANRKGRRNTPTIVNSGFQRSFFWDGRAVSLEEQAFGPIEADNEMAMSANEAVRKVAAIDGYVKLFEEAYPSEGVNKETIAKALASFQRTVVSDNTPFDAWVRGDTNATLGPRAMEGFGLFTGKGRCVKCHGGFNFTIESYENVGLGGEDLGLYELNKSRIWYGTFKTPTLREVAKTAPYFHDGSVHTLEEAVYLCGNGGRSKDAKRSPFFRDRGIGMDEMRAIVAFLQTLSSPDNDFEMPETFPQ